MYPLIAQTESAVTSPPVPLYLLLLVVGLGFLSIFLLLPRVKQFPVILGALTGLAALIMAGVWLLPFRGESLDAKIEMILFYAFSGIAVLSGGIMITQTKPVRAALSFAMVVLSTCGLFLLQAAPFLMASTIIVYAGAIVVTFLFVIMLSQQSGMDSADHRSREPFLASLAAFVFLGSVVLLLWKSQIQPVNNLWELQRTALQDIQLNREKLNEELDRIARVKTTKSTEPGLEILRDLQIISRDIKSRLTNHDEILPEKASTLYSPIIQLAEQLEFSVDDPSITWEVDEEKTKLANLILIEEKAQKLKQAMTDLDAEAFAYSSFSLLPAAGIPLTSFQSTPANVPPKKDKNGRSVMPAANVQAIGTSLFTENLLAVEMVAVLLLVATIGAIAIAGRHTEKLR